MNYKKNIAKISTIGCMTTLSLMLFFSLSLLLSNNAYAAKFDLNAFGAAALDPITQFVVKYWPAGLFISGTGGALLASGDLRTRAVGFGTGVAAGGLLIGGAANALGIM